MTKSFLLDSSVLAAVLNILGPLDGDRWLASGEEDQGQDEFS